MLFQYVVARFYTENRHRFLCANRVAPTSTQHKKIQISNTMTSRYFKERPSDDEGIRRQPRFKRTVPLEGSRRLAHNMPDSSKVETELLDLIPKNLRPLVTNPKKLRTGSEGNALRQTLRKLSRVFKNKLKETESTPERERLSAVISRIDYTVHKTTRFMREWGRLDSDKYLQHLIDTNDPLAPEAKSLLSFRLSHRGQKFTAEETLYHKSLSWSLRDKLMARIREKQQSPKK